MLTVEAYHEALRQGDARTLRRLADEAGYFREFDPLKTRFAQANGMLWAERYAERFTASLLRDYDTRFVTCWDVNGSGKTVLATGRFPERGERNFDNSMDEGSNMALYLLKVRESYRDGLLEKVMSPEDARKMGGGFVAVPIGAFTVVYLVTGRPQLSLVISMGAAALTASIARNLAFNRRGVKYESAAINYLVQEAQSMRRW